MTYPPEEWAELLQQLKEINCPLIDTSTHVYICQRTLHKREYFDLELMWYSYLRPWDMVLLANIETSQCCNSLLAGYQQMLYTWQCNANLTPFGILAAYISQRVLLCQCPMAST